MSVDNIKSKVFKELTTRIELNAETTLYSDDTYTEVTGRELFGTDGLSYLIEYDSPDKIIVSKDKEEMLYITPQSDLLLVMHDLCENI